MLSKGVLMPNERLPDILINIRQIMRTITALQLIWSTVKSFPAPNK